MAAAATASASVPGCVVQSEAFPVPPMSPAALKAIRDKVVTMFKEMVPDCAGGVILVKGADDTQRSNTDAEAMLRQESFFLYLTGQNEPGQMVLIEVDTGKTTLMYPDLGFNWVVWCGEQKSAEELQGETGAEAVTTTDKLSEVLTALAPSKVYLLEGVNTDSKLKYEAPTDIPEGSWTLDKEALHPVLVEARVTKTPAEVEIIWGTNVAASEGHLAVMAATNPYQLEHCAEALFRYYMQSAIGARYWSYVPICASGARNAVLHYGHAGAPNNKVVPDAALVLNDMGMETEGYASDITVTFPSNGKFTAPQAAIYNIVLKALNDVKAAMKPGVNWLDMHHLAYTVIGQGLLDLGLLQGTLEEVLAANAVSLFMPHGLGHLLGLETHDVGGYPTHLPDVKRDPRFGYSSLRTARDLIEGMVITVEPGIYFNPALLKKGLADPEQSKVLVAAKIEEYTPVGGVRLEDNILITADGIQCFTTVPRTVEEVELACSGQLVSLAQLRAMRE